MDATIHVRKRGTLTLPAELRQKYGVNPGDICRVIDLDGVFVLTPMSPMAPELAREIERLREAVGLSMDELLASLREQRERYAAGQSTWWAASALRRLADPGGDRRPVWPQSDPLVR